MKTKTKDSWLFKVGKVFTVIAQKFLPDAFIFAVILASIVFVAGLFLGNTPLKLVSLFTGGMWSLIGFTGQVVTMLILVMTFSKTRPAVAFINKITSVPKTPAQAIYFGTLLCIVLSSVNTFLGLVLSPIYAKEVVKKLNGVHYPILVAGCYAGTVVWHGGFGGTIPLLFATEGSYAAVLAGRVLPITKTLLGPLNLTLMIFFLITLPVLMAKLSPKNAEDVIEADLSLITEIKSTAVRPENPTPAQRLEYSTLLLRLVAVFMWVAVVLLFVQKGASALDFNSINLIFFALCLTFSENIIEMGKNAAAVAASATPIIIQFPIYAGIMGMSGGSGLATALTSGFVSISTATSFPNVVHLSSSILNMIIPSGGGKFALEAPIYIPAAQALGSNLVNVSIAAAWGDAVTNLIQPLWAVPLLTIAKLQIKDIMGYCAVACLFCWIFIQIILFLFGTVFI